MVHSNTKYYNTFATQSNTAMDTEYGSDYVHRTLCEALFQENDSLLAKCRRVGFEAAQCAATFGAYRERTYDWFVARIARQQSRAAFAHWACFVKETMKRRTAAIGWRAGFCRRKLFFAWRNQLVLVRALRENLLRQQLVAEHESRLKESLRAHDLETDLMLEEGHRYHCEDETDTLIDQLAREVAQVSALEKQLKRLAEEAAQRLVEETSLNEAMETNAQLRNQLRVQCALNRKLADRGSETLFPACITGYDATSRAWTMIGVVPQKNEKWSEALFRTLDTRHYYLTNEGIEKAVRQLAVQEHMPLDREALICLVMGRGGLDADAAEKTARALDEVAAGRATGGLCTHAALTMGQQKGFVDSATAVTLRHSTFSGVRLVQTTVAPGVPLLPTLCEA